MSTPPKPAMGVVYVRNIPVETKNAFKAWCFRRGMSMCQAIDKYMKECAREDRRLTPVQASKVRRAKRYNRKKLVKKKYGKRKKPDETSEEEQQ